MSEVLMYYAVFFCIVDFLDTSGQSICEWLSCLSNVLFVASFILYKRNDKILVAISQVIGGVGSFGNVATSHSGCD